MRQGVGLSRCSVARQREDRALADEVHRRGVLVQVVEDGRERRAGVKLLGRRRILGVHVDDEVGVFREERHLTFRIATIGAVRVGLDELPDGEAIRGLGGRDGDVLAHEWGSRETQDGELAMITIDTSNTVF